MNLYEKIPLTNGLTLTIWDNSRQIAADTTKVELVAQMEIAFEPSYFPRHEDYDKLVQTIGPTGLFEHRKMRPFVKTPQQEAVFQELLTAFKEHTLPYLSQDVFPRRFALAKFRDTEQNWYRYRPVPEEEG